MNKALDNLFGLGKIVRLPDDFFARIRALSVEGRASIRSRPQIATLNGHTASLTIGTTQYYLLRSQTPYQSPSTVLLQQSQRFEKIEANVVLDITPWVSASGEITADIRPEFSAPVGEFDPDGLTWQRRGGGLFVGERGAWDERGELGISIQKYNGYFLMAYASRPFGLAGAIGLAASRDGIEWTRHRDNPFWLGGNDPEFDGLGISLPSLIVSDEEPCSSTTARPRSNRSFALRRSRSAAPHDRIVGARPTAVAVVVRPSASVGGAPPRLSFGAIVFTAPRSPRTASIRRTREGSSNCSVNGARPLPLSIDQDHRTLRGRRDLELGLHRPFLFRLRLGLRPWRCRGPHLRLWGLLSHDRR